MILAHDSLIEFVEEVSSSSPAPGGGSVAAFLGAQGIALLAMIGRLTIQKLKGEEELLRTHLILLEQMSRRLLILVDEDTEGFQQVMTALALPRNNADDQAMRKEQIERATLNAARIPLKTAGLCLEGLHQVPYFLKVGQANTLSDLGVAILSLQAGLEGALYNVEINVRSLKGGEVKEELLGEMNRLREEGERISELGLIEIEGRLRKAAARALGSVCGGNSRNAD